MHPGSVHPQPSKSLTMNGEAEIAVVDESETHRLGKQGVHSPYTELYKLIYIFPKPVLMLRFKTASIQTKLPSYLHLEDYRYNLLMTVEKKVIPLTPQLV